jgi:hypothetical protein
MKSGLRSSRGAMSAQRQMNGCTRFSLLAISGPGRDQGASRPTSRTQAAYSFNVVGSVTAASGIVAISSKVVSREVRGQRHQGARARG